MIKWKVQTEDIEMYVERFMDVDSMKYYLEYVGSLYLVEPAFWNARYLSDWQPYSIFLEGDEDYIISPPPDFGEL